MRQQFKLSKFNAIAAVAAIAVAAALLGCLHTQAYADSPTPAAARASQSTDDASQALRRYTLQLLHILSDADSNQWERYRQSMPHCAAAPAYLDAIGSGSDVGPLDSTLIALTEDLCADLDRGLNEARTVGLLVNRPEAMSGYVLLTGVSNNDVHLIDHHGRIAHSWQFENRVSHAKLLDDGNLLIGFAGAPKGASGYNSVVEIDPDGNIVWKYTHSVPDKLHHDFLKMPNGNVLILAQGVKTEEEAIAAGANPDRLHIDIDAGMEYDYLIEVRPTGSEGGEIVWKWSTWDYLVQDFDPNKPNYGVIADHPELIDINYYTGRWSPEFGALDWQHTNAIDYNTELDQIVLSPRHFGELWMIDHSAATEDAVARSSGNIGNGNTPPRTYVLHSETGNNATRGGALLYRWGNPRAYGHGTPADQRLFWQHHTQWIDPGLPGEGNILVFNNGYERLGGGYAPYYSSIEEIVPSVDGYGYQREPGSAYPPDEPGWSYTADPPTNFYSRLLSGAQRLPNGNTLICEGMSGNVFQVTPDGKTVWQYVYPVDDDTPLSQGEQPSIASTLAQGHALFYNAVYRAYWYAPDHPGLQNYDLTPGGTIELYE